MIGSDDFVVIYGEGETPELSRALAQRLADKLEIAVLSDSSQPTEREILVGKTNRPESDISADLMEYFVGVVNGKLVVRGGGLFSTEQAVDAVIEQLEQVGSIYDIPTQKTDIRPLFDSCRGDYRIMEYNVLVEYPGWGCEKVHNPEVEVRREIIASMILGAYPDAAVLCEMFENWSEQLPPLIKHEYGLVAWNREDGYSNRTPIIYKKDRFELIEGGYEDIAIKKTKNRRVVTYAVLQDKITADKLIVFGTHFESVLKDNNPAENEEARMAQVGLLRGVVDMLLERHSGVSVISGDFNTGPRKPDHRAYDTLLSTFSDYENAVGSNPIVSLDHMFISHNAEIIDADVHTSEWVPFASDHKPVICDIKKNMDSYCVLC